jgi:hypothetical protein
MSFKNKNEGFPQPIMLAGSRKLNRRALGHGTSNLAQPTRAGEANVTISLESILEKKCAQHYLGMLDVRRVWAQAEPVEYTDAFGNLKYHTFDVMAERDDGYIIAIAAKPYEIALKKRLDLTLQQIALCITPDFADEVALFTDRTISRQAEVNNSRFHAYRKQVDQEAEAALMQVTRGLVGTAFIKDLVRAVGLDGRGFAAIFIAIYKGVLRQVSPGLIDYDTQVGLGVMS